MKIIDRYLIRSFLMPFFVSVLIFAVLVTLGRFFDKMEIFVRFHARFRDILVFILLGLPFWLNMVLPIATMLALLFSLGTLYQRGEFTAFRSAGIPSWRLYMPFAGMGLFLALLSFAGSLSFLPRINFQSRKIYRVEIKKRDILEYQKDNVVAAGRGHRRYTIGWLDVESGQMKDVVMDRFNDNLEWVETLSAKVAVFKDGKWNFKDGIWRVKDAAAPGGMRETPFTDQLVDIPDKPADFAVEDKETDDMTWRELNDRTERLQRQGAPSHRERVAWHMRMALPFANVIVIILAIPYALRSGTQARTQNFSFALLLAFFYWGLTSTLQSYGETGQMPAWVCAWMSNFVFGSVGLYKLARIS